MAETAKRSLDFGNFRLVPEDKLFLRDGKQVKLSRRGMAILCLLVEKRGQLVTKDRLMEEVWGPDTHVEEANIQVQVSAVRRALGDTKEEFIQTVHGEGYRFVADVTELTGGTPTGRVRRRSLVVGTILVGLVCALSAGFWFFLVQKGKSRHPTHDRTWRVVSQVSAGAKTQYELALQYEQQGDEEEALTALKEATSVTPDFGEAYLESALICHELGRQDQAREYLEQAERSSAHLDEYIRLKSDALRTELNDPYEEALKKYRLLADSYPDDISAKVYLAELALERRIHFGEAREALDECLRIESLSPYCNYNYMMWGVLESRFEEVIATYDRLKRRGVDYPWLYQPLGLALYGKGEFGAAADTLGKLSSRRKTHGLVHLTAAKEWAADMNLFRGNIACGRKEIEELSISDSPYERAAHLLYLAKIDVLLGNNQTARQEISGAVSVSGEREIVLDAVSLLALIGARDETAKMLKSIGEEPPRHVSAEFRHFISGGLALADGKISYAVSELSAAREIDDEVSTEYLLARALMAAQRWASAVAVLKDLEQSKGRVIADEAYPPIIWPLAKYHLAVAYDKMGDQAEAFSYYSQFISNWGSGDSNLNATH